jgi:hypothetical protein
MGRGSEETRYRMLYDFFLPHIRTRGNAYFHDGRVTLEKADKKHIKKKQELISSVLSGASSVVRSLSQEDLKVLFS